MKDSILSLLILSGSVLAFPAAQDLEKRDTMTAHVDLSSNLGAPTHLASGFIYGIPDAAGQIPDHWYTNMGFNYGRFGGAQLNAPARGWIWNEFNGRFQSFLSNYKTCRKYGAPVVILPHDIWGTDHANSSTVWPGDNGDFTNYDQFIQTLMSALKSNGATNGLVWDIWNEPDGSGFWPRPQQQWLNLYTRTHKALRADPAFKNVQISGPTLSAPPDPNDTWWTNWLIQVHGNNTIPDQYALHLESPSSSTDDPQFANSTLKSMLAQYGLPARQVNVNEYAVPSEQVPSGAAWWISRLERYRMIGLRGNWESGTELHDLFANLLTKSNNPAAYTATDYAPAAEYAVYEYYNLNMTGSRVATTGSDDHLLDTYATIGNGKVRAIVGARQQTGTWTLEFDNLSSLGFPTSGSITVQTYAFAGTNSITDVAPAVQNQGLVSHSYSGNTLSFPIYQKDTKSAYAFEFNFP